MYVQGNLGASLGAALNQSYSNSANSYANYGGAENLGQSANEGYSNSASESWSNSWTDAETARNWSAEQAAIAWARDKEAMYEQMAYNTMEAEKQREWQAKMANTLYTRSTKNMKEAGINPILASSMGLSGASVGSGATASLGGIPSAPLAQSFMDSYSNSGSRSYSNSYNWGSGSSSGSSWSQGSGSGWSQSEGGIATALTALGNMAESSLELLNSGIKTEEASKIWDKFVGGDYPGFIDVTSDYIVNGIKKGMKNIGNNIVKWFKGKNENWYDRYGSDKGGGHSF